MVRLACNLGRGGTKKSSRYQVLYPVENPPKIEPFWSVPCRAMQWKSAIGCPRGKQINQIFIFVWTIPLILLLFIFCTNNYFVIYNNFWEDKTIILAKTKQTRQTAPVRSSTPEG